MGMFRSSLVNNFDTIYVQDFGDDYHHPYFSEDNNDDIRRAAKGIMTQYTSIEEYEEALEIYKLYMEDLVDRCGGKTNYEVYKSSNSIPFFVPPKPQLKKTIENEMYKKYGLANFGFMSRANLTKQRQMAQGAIEFFKDNCDLQLDENDCVVISAESGMDINDVEALNVVLDREENGPDYKEKPSNLNTMMRFFDDYGGTPMVGRTKPGLISAEKLDPYIVPSLAELASYGFNPDEFYMRKSEKEAEKHKRETIGNSAFNFSGTKEDRQKAELINDLTAEGWDPDFMLDTVEKGSALETYLKEDQRLADRARERRARDRMAESIEDMMQDTMYNLGESTYRYSDSDDIFGTNYDGGYTEIF